MRGIKMTSMCVYGCWENHLIGVFFLDEDEVGLCPLASVLDRLSALLIGVAPVVIVKLILTFASVSGVATGVLLRVGRGVVVSVTEEEDEVRPRLSARADGFGSCAAAAWRVATFAC